MNGKTDYKWCRDFPLEAADLVDSLCRELDAVQAHEDNLAAYQLSLLARIDRLEEAVYPLAKVPLWLGGLEHKEVSYPLITWDTHALTVGDVFRAREALK